MKKLALLLLISFFVTNMSFVYSQTLTKQQEKTVKNLFKKRGEIYFEFTIQSKSEMATLTNIISIDNVKNTTVRAFANKKGFKKFLALGYSYTILKSPNQETNVIMDGSGSMKQLKSFLTAYPTYPSYLNIMQQFATNYPTICKLHTIATLPSGRKLLILKITDNINTKENEPQFLYSSTMHGDETAGYIGMLNYIDYLLTNYGTNTQVTNLVNNMEIWINPLANPDGTYAGGNNTVSGATRYNANFVDLNRNYPDPLQGPHPDGEIWQPETQAFMSFADTMNFVMAANFHGGAEVINYPWDYKSNPTADANWWIQESQEYVNTARIQGMSYMTDVISSGVINGFDWYEVHGGRQDYMNWFHHCREFTVELSAIKIMPNSQILSNWNYNYISWMNYMEEALHGFRGIITDACTNLPIKAKVFIASHDFDSSHVYSSLPVGNYHRPIYQGTYSATFSAPGYQSKTISNIVVTKNNITTLNVSLQPSSPTIASATITGSSPYCQGQSETFTATAINGGASPIYQWKINNSTVGTNSATYTTSALNSGDAVKCVVTSSNSCVTSNPSTSNTITVFTLAPPSTPVISQLGSTLTSSASSGNQWYNATTGALPGQTNVNYLASSGGTYFVIATGSNGCSSDSSNFITVVGIDELETIVFTIYPNPTAGFFTLSTMNSNFKNYTVELINVLGAKVYEENSNKETLQINTVGLENGIYFLKITSDKKSGMQKIMVKN